MTRGIDVSYYDGLLDWEKYTWDFAYIKISEGTVGDPAFALQWISAKNKTIRGAYHFFRSFVDPKLAVEKIAKLLGNDLGELPLALDLEATDGRSDTLAKASTFQAEYKKISGHYPIIYTSPGFINLTKMYLYPEYSNYKLWIASYPFDNYPELVREKTVHDVLIGERALLIPAAPKPFGRITFYQWTGKGNPLDVPGYTNPRNKKAVDFDLFNGTPTQLLNEFDIENNQGENMADITLTADLKSGLTSNVHEAADLSSPISGRITGPATIQGIGQKVSNDGFEWIQIISPKVGYVALTVQYTNINYTPPVVVANKKVVKSTILFDDNSTIDLFPQ